MSLKQTDFVCARHIGSICVHTWTSLHVHTPGLLLAHTFYVTELGRNTANFCVCVREDLLYEHLLCRGDHLFLFSSRSGGSMWL